MARNTRDYAQEERHAAEESDRVAAEYDAGRATKADVLRAERKLYRAIQEASTHGS